MRRVQLFDSIPVISWFHCHRRVEVILGGMKLTIDVEVYRLTDVDTRSLFSDKTDKTGPLLKSKKKMSRLSVVLRLGSLLF